MVVSHVASRVSTQNNQIFQIWTDLYHLSYNQSKTGVRMRLTSQIKELGAILQKLIKYEPGLVNNDDEKHL